MRPAIFALVVVVAGCVDNPVTPAAGVPVVVLGSEFFRTHGNGTGWEPPFPGFHGCDDPFELDRRNRTIEVNEDWNGGDWPRPAAVLIYEDRDPEAFYENHQLVLPAGLPHTQQFLLGNIEGREMRLEIREDQVRFNGAVLVEGRPMTQRFDYGWRMDDGTLLNVTERTTAELVGHWPDPVQAREARYCL